MKMIHCTAQQQSTYRSLYIFTGTILFLLHLLPHQSNAQSLFAPPIRFPFPVRSSQIEPSAGRWKTWVLNSGSDLRPPRPDANDTLSTQIELQQLFTMIGRRDAAALDLIGYWDTGSPSFRWNELARTPILTRFNNVTGGRALALLNIAIYDAMIAAWDAKYVYNRPRPAELAPWLKTIITTPSSPSYPCEQAVAAGAASAVLAYLFPADAQFYQDKAEEAGRSRLLAGVNFQSDVTAGLELGRAVAAQVIERARMDGSSAVFTGTIPTGACNWKGTNPVAPLAGTWKPWVLAAGNEFRPGPPPTCDSVQLGKELAEVKSFVRTVNSNAKAFFWQVDLAATMHWNDLTSRKLAEYRLDLNPPRAARAYALVSIAGYDGMIAGWDAKYAYWQIRPNQLDSTVTTLFPTPAHPSYPSAHSSISGPQAEVLAYLFPREADFFRAQAREASEARIWAGIHFRSDIEAGLELGRAVGGKIIERARNDGSQ